MRVRCSGYNYDIETSPGYADNYFGGYIEPSYQRISIEGFVQGYVREGGITYAIVLTDHNSLIEVELEDLEVIVDAR